MDYHREFVKGSDVRKPKKLIDRARDAMRIKHYSISTEEAYIGWMIRYIHFQ